MKNYKDISWIIGIRWGTIESILADTLLVVQVLSLSLSLLDANSSELVDNIGKNNAVKESVTD